MCEPRHVCTPATCTGFAGLLMSKIRTPLNCGDAGFVEQSVLALASSTDMNSRFPNTDMSPWKPGQITVATRVGFAGLAML